MGLQIAMMAPMKITVSYVKTVHSIARVENAFRSVNVAMELWIVTITVTSSTVVLGVQSNSLPAPMVLVSTVINAVIDVPTAVTVAMKSTVELTIHHTSNDVRADTNAQKVPASNVLSCVMVTEIVAMDQTSVTARADRPNSPAVMESAFQTTWYATRARTAEISRTREIVPALEENSVAALASAYLLPGDVI